MAAVLKTAEAKAFVGSNPTRSASRPPDAEVQMTVARHRRVPVVPATFARLAASGGHPVETTMIAPGGAFLADHAAKPDVAAAIAGTRWFAVVLQEQSQVPASASARDAQMLPASSSLVAEIRAAGGVPYLLETWAHRDGWPEQGLDRAAMQAAIDASYAQVADRTASFVVPVGDAWQRALAEDPSLVLWQDDGSHPTPAGTYLAACVLYGVVWHATPVGLPDTGGLAAAVAAELQRAATGE